jgi:EAL domain-containing protein (putative c-di-GMP-specific phosphodiesterase class I)
METSREHSDVLRRLRASRVRLALDDFGTGYSSLEYLHRFPVDRIKIAQSFVLGLGSVAGDAAIVKAALGLARELGLSAIAEGVETEGQLRLLREWGCPEVQGYYFSPPLAADGMRELLRAGRVRVLVEGATPVGA